MQPDGYSSILDRRRMLAQEEIDRQSRLEHEYDFQKLQKDNERLEKENKALRDQLLALGVKPVEIK